MVLLITRFWLARDHFTRAPYSPILALAVPGIAHRRQDTALAPMQAQADPLRRYGRGHGTTGRGTRQVSPPGRVPGIQLQQAVKGGQLERIVACTTALFLQSSRNRSL